MSVARNQVLLTFESDDDADFVKLVCRRKGTTIESYIVDNMEWDDKLDCLYFEHVRSKPKKKMCRGCEYSDTCPDSKVGKGEKRCKK